MKRLLATFSLCAALVCAGAHASDTFRFGQRLIETGDPVTKLLQLAGDPAYKEPIENGNGAYRGERWQYVIDGVAVTFTIRDAKVESIQQAARD
jgi:hypothetical protein